MPDSYLDLYKLEITGQPFEVARIIDSDLQNSPECQLPDLIPPAISLPSLNVTLPPPECNYNVDVPLIPPPFFCSPSFTSDVLIYSCDPSSVAVTGGLTVESTVPGGCDYVLGGTIEVCPTFDFGGLKEIFCEEIFASSAFSASGTKNVDLTGTVALLSTRCGVALAGNLALSWTGPELCDVAIGTDFKQAETADIDIVPGAVLHLTPKMAGSVSGGPCDFSLDIGVSISGSTSGLSVRKLTVCTDGTAEELDIVVVQ